MAAFIFRFVNGGTSPVGSGCNTGGGGTVLPPPPPPTQPANPGDTKNCGDFDTWQAAQSWFDTYYPYYGDVARLDSDGDRIACETLPGHP
ncbi:excalibur calcium-binding domain-containing protein [Arthrobacter sp. H14-L1]|nr:excalibur calcium-binding domain-containing protein [Arthrobacter sp. H14-L1]